MSRKIFKKRAFPEPDFKYNSRLVNLLIIRFLRRGKKFLAQKIVNDAFDIIEKRTKKNPLLIFEKAIRNVQPITEVKSKRKRGSVYQVPVPVSAYRAINLSLKWIVQATNKRAGKSVSVRLANELIDASNNTGAAVRKRDETHKMADANKAFSHIRS